MVGGDLVAIVHGVAEHDKSRAARKRGGRREDAVEPGRVGQGGELAAESGSVSDGSGLGHS